MALPKGSDVMERALGNRWSDNGISAAIGEIPVESVADMLRKPQPRIEWLVEGYFPHPSITLLVGDGGAFKSLYAQALAVSVAAGVPLFNRFKTPSAHRVVYVQSESGRRDFRSRLLRIAQGAGIDYPYDELEALHAVSNVTLDLGSANDFDRFKERVIHQIEPELVIIDALIDFHTADENSSKEIRPLALNLRSLRDEYGTSVLILHHTNKSPFATKGSSKMRGTTALWNAMDGRWVLERNGDDAWARFTGLYQKESGPSKLFSFAPNFDEWNEITFDIAMTGDSNEKPSKREWTDTRLLRAIDQLRRSDFVPGYSDIAIATTLSESSIVRRVKRLEGEGRVRVENVRVAKTKRHGIIVTDLKILRRRGRDEERAAA